MIFKKYLGRVQRGKKENENYPDIANVLICIVNRLFPHKYIYTCANFC